MSTSTHPGHIRRVGQRPDHRSTAIRTPASKAYRRISAALPAARTTLQFTPVHERMGQARRGHGPRLACAGKALGASRIDSGTTFADLMLRTLSCTVMILLVAGCAAPVNIRNAEAHAQAGYAAEARGDWETARRQFAQAVVDADLGNADASGKGQVNYEYGRVLGVMCDWNESEKYLLRSRQLAEESGRAPYLPVYELGLLNERQGKAAQATLYFGQLLPLMEKANLRTRFPLGVADAYERHARALARIGQPAQAEAELAEARRIRQANPGAAQSGAVTPYGTACTGAR